MSAKALVMQDIIFITAQEEKWNCGTEQLNSTDLSWSSSVEVFAYLMNWIANIGLCHVLLFGG